MIYIRATKLKETRREEYLTCMEGRDMLTGSRCGNLKEGDHLDDLGMDGRLILKTVLNK
jgi:hypothetical protein